MCTLKKKQLRFYFRHLKKVQLYKLDLTRLKRKKNLLKNVEKGNEEQNFCALDSTAQTLFWATWRWDVIVSWRKLILNEN